MPIELTPDPAPGRRRDASTLENIAVNLYRRRTGKHSWWFFLYRSPVTGKRIEMSLGPCSLVTITQAKAMTLKHRVALLEGRCPLAERQAERTARRAPTVPTFHAAFQLYLAAHETGWRNAKHAAQWSRTIETYACPVLRDLAVDRIGTAEVMLVLEPVWHSRPETASRLRQRIEAILDYCQARQWCQAPNPARWKGHLARLLPSPGKLRPVRHHAALV